MGFELVQGDLANPSPANGDASAEGLVGEDTGGGAEEGKVAEGESKGDSAEAGGGEQKGGETGAQGRDMVFLCVKAR